MKKLSVVVITRNEAANIRRCLESVVWADELIVVDSQSTDDTCAIARAMGADVLDHAWQGYGPAKAFGVTKTRNDWVLSIDADEALSPQLADEIQAALSDDSAFDGYDMPRRTNFLGRWIGHSGWYPDRVLRLFDRQRGRVKALPLHESIEVQGDVGHLKGDLLHYCYPSLEHYLSKSNRYTTLGAEQAFAAGKRAGWFDIVIRPPVAFIKQYVSKQGFRDGLEGFLVSFLSAVAVMVKYAKLRHLQKRTVTMKEDNA